MAKYIIEITEIRKKLPATNWFAGTCRAVKDTDEGNADAVQFSGEMSISGVVPGVCEGAPYLLQCTEMRWNGQPQLKIERGCVAERLDRLQSQAGAIRYLTWVKKAMDANRAIEGLDRVGIGGSRIAGLVGQYGVDAVRIAREEPERVSEEVKGWTLDRASVFSEQLKRHEDDENTLKELATLGVNGALSQRQQDILFLDKGRAAPAIVRDDPYALIKWLDHYGWGRADTLAIKNLNWNPSKPSRINAALHHVIGEEGREGHCYMNLFDGVGKASKLSSKYTPGEVQRFIRYHHSMIRIDDYIRVVGRPDGDRLYLERTRAAEVSISRFLRARVSGPKALNMTHIKGFANGLNELQTQAFWSALSYSLAILRGGPGRGKTHTCKSIVEALVCAGRNVLILAPTGRAAARATELTGVPAETIHRYLRRTRNEGDCETNYFVIDECSMVDLRLMARFLSTVDDRQCILFVGDSDQLPSVQAGRVFIDMINSGIIPEVELTEIMRTDRQGIISAATIANQSGMNEVEVTDALIGAQDNSFGWIPVGGVEARDAVIEHVKSLIAEGVSADSIQVISANNGYRKLEGEPKPLDSRSLNEALQPILNPDAKLTTANSYGEALAVGDRVMNMKNQVGLTIYNPENIGRITKGDVMNGEIGYVIGEAVDKSGAIIVCEFGRESGAPKLFSWPIAGHKLQRCYAATCHKFQGSEAPNIILVFDRTAGPVVDKSWLYTGVTRASATLLIVAPEEDIAKAIKRPSKASKRRSGLPELLSGEDPGEDENSKINVSIVNRAGLSPPLIRSV